LNSRRRQQPVPRPNRERVLPFKDAPELLTDKVFLIGNGTSRKDFDLEKLRGHGTIIGCNALYRDFSPDLLIAIDAKMLTELRKNKYCDNHHCIVPVSRQVVVPNSMKWRTDKFNTSGCFAMKLISLVMRPKVCYMLGMDGFPGNMYDKTANYAINTLQNFTGIATYYMKTLNQAEDIMFVNVNIKDAWPSEAHATGVYSYMTYEEFEALYSNWQRERA
jgi:hypothetical protein